MTLSTFSDRNTRTGTQTTKTEDDPTEPPEIGAYATLFPVAIDLGMDDAAEFLEQSRTEEENALNTLSYVQEEFDRNL